MRGITKTSKIATGHHGRQVSNLEWSFCNQKHWVVLWLCVLKGVLQSERLQEKAFWSSIAGCQAEEVSESWWSRLPEKKATPLFLGHLKLAISPKKERHSKESVGFLLKAGEPYMFSFQISEFFWIFTFFSCHFWDEWGFKEIVEAITVSDVQAWASHNLFFSKSQKQIPMKEQSPHLCEQSHLIHEIQGRITSFTAKWAIRCQTQLILMKKCNEREFSSIFGVCWMRCWLTSFQRGKLKCLFICFGKTQNNFRLSALEFKT